MSYEQAIEKLGLEIKTLRIDYERFFAGGLDVPPDDLRAAIGAEFKALRNSNITSAADNFRLSSLEAQFSTYSEFYRRRLRDREEGRERASQLAAAPRRAPAHDPDSGITLGGDLDPVALEALHVGLCRGSDQALRMDLESFRRYLEQQVEAIRVKTGCTQVQFRVATEDGKKKLKAKPLGLRATA